MNSRTSAVGPVRPWGLPLGRTVRFDYLPCAMLVLSTSRPAARSPARLLRGASAGWWCVALMSLYALVPARGAETSQSSIAQVEIRDRAFRVNGQPFFPIMGWLQPPKNLALLKECGFNTTAGYWGGAGGTKNAAEFVELARQAGLYAVMPFQPALQANANILGYIHDDEPDLDRKVSDARVEAGTNLHLNPSTPLYKLVDGDLSSWTVLDPLEGSSVRIRAARPATIVSVGVALTVSPGLSLPKELIFESGGKELLKVALAPQRGRQKFALPQLVRIEELTVRTTAITPGREAYGSLGEIEAWNADGANVLLSPPRQVPQALPDVTLKNYAAVKAADATRPVFMTLTGNFLPFFKKWPEMMRASMYPAYIQASDVVGYDIYPIYGWNKPEWLDLGHDATELLAHLAGPRPIYAWIETSKGGQWTGPIEGQREVTPEHIRAEVWMCLCRGATAIGYFTHVWKPRFAEFGAPEANRRALREINTQITRLTPALLGQPLPESAIFPAESGVKLDVMARQSGADTYLFAVNFDPRLKRTEATLKLPGLRAGSPVEVVDENRTISAQDGDFNDTFAPLAVHVYRVGR